MDFLGPIFGFLPLIEVLNGLLEMSYLGCADFCLFFEVGFVVSLLRKEVFGWEYFQIDLGALRRTLTILRTNRVTSALRGVLKKIFVSCFERCGDVIVINGIRFGMIFVITQLREI